MRDIIIINDELTEEIATEKRWLREWKLQIKYYDEQRIAIAKRNKNNRSKII